MSLTKCPECSRLCFSDDSSCLTCLRGFHPNELRDKAIADNRAFDRKWNIVFLTLFLILMGALLVVVLRPQSSLGRLPEDVARIGPLREIE